MTLTETPLRKIAAEHPAALSIFDRFEIDLCHMGSKTLAEACASLNLSAEQVQEKIFALTSFSSSAPDPGSLTLTQLIQRIVRAHHRRVRQDLPALSEMAARIELNHAERNPENIPLARLVAELHRDMFAHIGREEQVLFPFIARMEEESRLSYPADHSCFSALSAPIARMLQDHDSASQILDELRQRTNDFTPHREACGTKRALFAGLKTFDADTELHMGLESEILFPRSLALEAELAARPQCGIPS